MATVEWAPARRLKQESPSPAALADALREAGIDPSRADGAPFVLDGTGGAEAEMQVAVRGRSSRVDLPRSIRESSFFADVTRRADAGDTSKHLLDRLEDYLESNDDGVWENSWVRVPRRLLTPYADSIFESDLRRDKADPKSLPRLDAARFVVLDRGEEALRLPVSYLLKLALADSIDGQTDWLVRAAALRVMSRLLSDNTSPETVSFHTPRLHPETGGGAALAREASRRYLVSQLLVAYANDAFELSASDQHVLLFDSPHPPVRQRRLNDAISDSFYRELFMSPCLSGWDRGEAKRDYMALCHQTLSRSQLNAVGKLREAGVITRNLVVLPNTSNVSLANNGVHVSLGSERLSRMLAAEDSAFGPEQEKSLGDLVIKIVEHFLPLFVGTYSAAPYRLDFKDFHPERALGFLAHQLDYTHLRAMWRRWRGKARNRVLGRSVGPFGPEWLDESLARLFGLKGDFVPDFRLIDYLAAPMSTERSPALDGRLGNEQRLLDDLDHLGVFDARMALYRLYRMRDYASMGFSGFEGRCYSLFESLSDDMRHAVNLQQLVTAVAYRWALSGRITHADIPDRPVIESERRQIFFSAAVGLPTFYIDSRSRNSLLRRIVDRAGGTRSSRRYPGRTRCRLAEYRRSLTAMLEKEAADLIEAMGLAETMRDLRARHEDPEEASASGKLTRAALRQAGAREPLELGAEEFNSAAERAYRGELRVKKLAEAWEGLLADAHKLESDPRGDVRAALEAVLEGRALESYLHQIGKDLLAERLPCAEIRRVLHVLLIGEHVDRLEHEA